MRKITMWFIATVAVVVLLFSYRTSTGPASPAPAAASDGGNGPGIVSGSAPPPDSQAADGRRDDAEAPASRSNASSRSGPTPAPLRGTVVQSGPTTVVNGPVVLTNWGYVQVQVEISGDRITEITPLKLPDLNSRDLEINQYAVPQLREKALAAQSANIDAVSGATATSEGYTKSLQAALDTAQFKADR